MAEQRDNVEKTLGKILTVVLLLSFLMSIFLYYFFKQEEQIEQTGLRTIVANFNSQLLVVRSQWLMDKKPNQVIINVDDTNGNVIQNRITVNANGWIDVTNTHGINSDTNKANSTKALASGHNICQEIWQSVMDRPLAFFNVPIGTVLMNQSQNNIGHICRYIIKNGSYFEYNSKNGNVSEVYNKKNE